MVFYFVVVFCLYGGGVDLCLSCYGFFKVFFYILLWKILGGRMVKLSLSEFVGLKFIDGCVSEDDVIILCCYIYGDMVVMFDEGVVLFWLNNVGFVMLEIWYELFFEVVGDILVY